MLAGHNFFTPSFILLTDYKPAWFSCKDILFFYINPCRMSMLTQWNFLIGIKEITHWIPASVKSLFQRAVNCLHGGKTYLTEEVLIHGIRQVIFKKIKNIPGEGNSLSCTYIKRPMFRPFAIW